MMRLELPFRRAPTAEGRRREARRCLSAEARGVWLGELRTGSGDRKLLRE